DPAPSWRRRRASASSPSWTRCRTNWRSPSSSRSATTCPPTRSSRRVRGPCRSAATSPGWPTSRSPGSTRGTRSGRGRPGRTPWSGDATTVRAPRASTRRSRRATWGSASSWPAGTRGSTGRTSSTSGSCRSSSPTGTTTTASSRATCCASRTSPTRCGTGATSRCATSPGARRTGRATACRRGSVTSSPPAARSRCSASAPPEGGEPRRAPGPVDRPGRGGSVAALLAAVAELLGHVGDVLVLALRERAQRLDRVGRGVGFGGVPGQLVRAGREPDAGEQPGEGAASLDVVRAHPGRGALPGRARRRGRVGGVVVGVRLGLLELLGVRGATAADHPLRLPLDLLVEPRAVLVGLLCHCRFVLPAHLRSDRSRAGVPKHGGDLRGAAAAARKGRGVRAGGGTVRRMLPREGVNAVRVVVGLLVRGDYEELETLTEGRRFSAAEMADAIAGRGLDLIDPPEDAYDAVDAVEVPGTGPAAGGRRAFGVTFPLWTAQEGRSALALRLTLSEVMDGVWTVELDAIGAA